jgi:ABC-type phosphate transport system ATPase subunit
MVIITIHNRDQVERIADRRLIIIVGKIEEAKRGYKTFRQS